jgi:subtilisin family serine protease
MAAPQVTGTAGLVRSRNPDLGAKEVERAIKDGADLVTGESDEDLGAGRLNAADAVDEA